MLLVSLVLHAIVLMLPTSFQLKTPDSPKKEETVKITRLPRKGKSSSQSSPQSSPNPKLTPQLTPQRGQTANLSQKPQGRQVNFPEKADTLVVSQSDRSPKQPSNQQSVTSEVSGKTSKKSQQDSATPQGADEGSGSAEKITNFFEIFPRYPGAKKGSGGVLRPQFDGAAYLFHTEDAWQTVASKFEKELLPNQNFTRPKPINNYDGFIFYEVSTTKGNETKYLYLIAQEGKTAIFLESEQYSREQLMQSATEDRNDDLFMAAVSVAIELVKKQYDLKDFDPAADLDILQQTDKFKNKNFDFKNARKTTPDKPVSSEELTSMLSQQLQLQNFEALSKVCSYGGGTVSQVKKDDLESYLILAPTKDNQTVILLSKSNPCR